MSDVSDLLFRGSLCLGLGLIIGFQRERKESTIAGIRTFPIFALVGFFCALIESAGADWIIAGGLIGLSAVLFRTTDPSSGITTEMSALFIYLIGAYLAIGKEVEIAIVSAGVCALLLHLKETMHSWVGHMQRREVRAIMQFVLIALVILPVLPDKSYDNFEVLNPKEIWMMVVLITGISLASFSAQKILGPKVGSLWSGILGGLISSTATTLSMARLSTRVLKVSILVPAILIASTSAFIRILFEVLLVAPKALNVIAAPLSMLFLVMVVQSGFSYLHASKEAAESATDAQNPSQIKAALVFGFLYAIILYLSALARDRFGESGLYLVALFSGLFDVDAITISTARLLQQGIIDDETGWKSILLALLSNLGFKTGLVVIFGNSKLKLLVSLHFGLTIICGLLIFFFWS